MPICAEFSNILLKPGPFTLQWALLVGRICCPHSLTWAQTFCTLARPVVGIWILSKLSSQTQLTHPVKLCRIFLLHSHKCCYVTYQDAFELSGISITSSAICFCFSQSCSLVHKTMNDRYSHPRARLRHIFCKECG